MGYITLGTNKDVLHTIGSMERTGKELSSTYAKLSSGQRITKVSDDIAGLCVSTDLRKDAKILTQAIKNINEGIAITSIASDALNALSEITIRRKELAERSANGIFTDKQRKVLNKEFDELDDEFDRIIQSTSYNGINILNGETEILSLEVGRSNIDLDLRTFIPDVTSGGSSEIGFSRRESYNTTSPNGGSPGEVAIADLNGDGKADVINSDYGTDEQCPNYSSEIYISFGNGDGTLQEGQKITVGTNSRPRAVVVGDINGDGKPDIAVSTYSSDSESNDKDIYVLTGDGNGNFSAPTDTGLPETFTAIHEMTVGDVTGDSKDDIIVTGRQGSGYVISVQTFNGSTYDTISTSLGGNKGSYTIETSELDGDAKQEIIVGNRSAKNIEIYSASSGSIVKDKTISVGKKVYDVASKDVDGDGFNDIVAAAEDSIYVYKNDGNGNFSLASQFSSGMTNATSVDIGDIDGDGILDLAATSTTDSRISVYKGNGDGTFQEGVQYKTGTSPLVNGMKLGDLNNDGKADAVYSNSGDGTISVSIAQKGRLSILTQEDAIEALTSLEKSIDSINTARGYVGAYESRLNTAYNVTSVMRENYESAYSAITNIDVSEETVKMARLNILEQSAAAIVAQANMQPELALAVLRGTPATISPSAYHSTARVSPLKANARKINVVR